jgi:tetratricopeptide (TPR) repeat protein
MRSSLAYLRLLTPLLFLASVNILCAPLGTISGVTRDKAGQTLSRVHLTLKSVDTPLKTWQSISGSSGEFTFTSLFLGEYTISAQLAGYESVPASTIRLVADNTTAHVDLILVKPGGEYLTSGGAADVAPPRFEAAGVRGLIDSGGYSASAQGAANSGLIKGMADIRRGGNAGADAEKEWPCHLEASLLASVKTDPVNPAAKRSLGEFYLAHNQPAKAIPYLQAAQTGDTTDYALSRDLALAWIRNDQFELARQLLLELAADHNDSEIHTLLAQADEGAGLFKQASAEYEIAAAKDLTENNLFAVGYELILAGLPSQATDAFQSGLRKYPASIKLLIGAGTVEFVSGKTADGVDYFLRATDLAPADPRPYLFLENALSIQLEQIDRVRASFKRYWEMVPDNPDASYGYALVLWQARGPEATSTDLNRIKDLLKRTIQLNPDFAKAHFQLAMLYSESGDNQSATQEYQTALHIAPNMNEAHYRLAMAYRRAGQGERAEQEMRLFQEARAQGSAENGKPVVNIEELISVLRPREQKPEHQNACPEDLQ